MKRFIKKKKKAIVGIVIFISLCCSKLYASALGEGAIAYGVSTESKQTNASFDFEAEARNQADIINRALDVKENAIRKANAELSPEDLHNKVEADADWQKWNKQYVSLSKDILARTVGQSTIDNAIKITTEAQNYLDSVKKDLEENFESATVAKRPSEDEEKSTNAEFDQELAALEKNKPALQNQAIENFKKDVIIKQINLLNVARKSISSVSQRKEIDNLRNYLVRKYDDIESYQEILSKALESSPKGVALIEDELNKLEKEISGSIDEFNQSSIMKNAQKAAFSDLISLKSLKTEDQKKERLKQLKSLSNNLLMKAITRAKELNVKIRPSIAAPVQQLNVSDPNVSLVFKGATSDFDAAIIKDGSSLLNPQKIFSSELKLLNKQYQAVNKAIKQLEPISNLPTSLSDFLLPST